MLGFTSADRFDSYCSFYSTWEDAANLRVNPVILQHLWLNIICWSGFACINGVWCLITWAPDPSKPSESRFDAWFHSFVGYSLCCYNIFGLVLTHGALAHALILATTVSVTITHHWRTRWRLKSKTTEIPLIWLVGGILFSKGLFVFTFMVDDDLRREIKIEDDPRHFAVGEILTRSDVMILEDKSSRSSGAPLWWMHVIIELLPWIGVLGPKCLICKLRQALCPTVEEP